MNNAVFFLYNLYDLSAKCAKGVSCFTGCSRSLNCDTNFNTQNLFVKLNVCSAII